MSGVAMPWTADDVEIDAFSTNLNFIAVNTEGIIAEGNYTYAGLEFSTVQGADHSSAHIFEYIFPGSVVPPDVDVDKIVVSKPIQNLWLSGTPDSNVVGVDLYAPVLQQPQPVTEPTIHASFLGAMWSVKGGTEYPSAWSNGGSGSSTATGNEVFVSYYDATSGWGAVQEYPDTLAVDTDIDALSWYRRESETGTVLREFVIFSTTSTALDPLLFHEAGASTTHVLQFLDASTSSVSPVSTRMPNPQGKVRVTDIDALTVFDPQDAFMAPYNSGLGRPTTSCTVVGSLQVNVYRELNPGVWSDIIVVYSDTAPLGTEDYAIISHGYVGDPPTSTVVALPPAGGTAAYSIPAPPTTGLTNPTYEVRVLTLTSGDALVSASSCIRLSL